MPQTTSVSPDRNDRRYIATAMQVPLLERAEESALARRWRDHGDKVALQKIITAHIRLVVRIAAGFRGYGLPLSDLIQEGNVGLLEAANRFDPDREVRFSTYATWWILAAIQEYIVRNASIVRIGTTPAQKSLFFNLRRLRARIGSNPSGPMTSQECRRIADELRVPIEAVERMEAHLSRPDRSLNAGIGGEDTDELQDFLADSRPTPEADVMERRDRRTFSMHLQSALQRLTPRERQIITRRFLNDDRRTTLADIGEDYGVTKERIRQIESKALGKLRQYLGSAVDPRDAFAT
ncbi:MAG: RNA polymerase factor sigma-32 [Alphaproteobacteria bacterium]|nr:RNA polymerase factor sigma-32 [Alphaproteobacteria bacterium]